MPGPLVYIETFGCQMNELDSELVVGRLAALGYRFTPDAAAAQVVLYNTCSVREHAEQKVWSRLGELALRKRTDPRLVVGVLGCMAEREGTAMLKRRPVVDLLVGPGELDKVPAMLDNAVRTRAALADGETGVARLSGGVIEGTPARAAQVALQGHTSRRSATLAAAADTLELLDLSRAISADDHHGSAYVRITRGCNKFCTYCVVPSTRGAEVHRPPDHIVDECRRLADAGVVEVTLLGQTVNHYRFEHGAAVAVGGITQPQKGRAWGGGATAGATGARVTTFADLLARIHDEVPRIARLRFVTSYPRDFGDDVLGAIRDHPRLCRYLHVPAQSGSNRVLARMNRGYTVEQYFEFLDRARAALHQPEIGRPLTVAGDIIVGFPGETDDDHEGTRALLRRARYKNCFIFKYSSRPGTPAHQRLPDDVPEAVKRRRNADLLALQTDLSAQVSAEFVGQTLDVFVQGVSKREARQAQRATRGAPATIHGGVTLTIGGRAAGAEAVADRPLEDATATAPVQLSGRTDGDVIVFFDSPAGASPDDLIGTIRRVRIEASRPLALYGTL